MVETATQIEVCNLGQIAYEEAFSLQKGLLQRVIDARADSPRGDHAGGWLLLLEHVPPVITVSRRPSARDNLVATEAQLDAAGVTIAETNRGGDITYHGPGQLVVYPILDLNALELRARGYMRTLEQVVIDVLQTFGVSGVRNPGAAGVWVERPEGLAKICAMGVRISRWVSMHGLALNVTTNLKHFDLIVPCGLAGTLVTSLQRELGERCPPMDEVKMAMTRRFLRLTADRRS